jgi:hypothetical protein
VLGQLTGLTKQFFDFTNATAARLLHLTALQRLLKLDSAFRKECVWYSGHAK